MNSNINILFVIDSFFDGGAEVFAIRLANEVKKYVNVYFLELRPECSTVKDQMKLLDDDIPLFQTELYFLTLRRYLRPFGVFKIIRKLHNLVRIRFVLKILNENNINIVHSHCWATDYFFSSIKQNQNFHLVSTFHGHYELQENQSNAYIQSTTEILNNVDRVAYLSPRHLETLKKFGYSNHRAVKIFHGHKFARTDKVTEFNADEPLRLCIVSRAISEKGWEDAIKAVIRINSSNSKKHQVELTLVGNGDYYDYLVQNYDEYNFIHFTGYQSEVGPYIENSHICMLPSTYAAESLPISVIEYLFKGKPVIATDVGAIPEMIKNSNDVAGTIVALRNNRLVIDDLIKAIKAYIENPERVRIESSIATQASKKFEMDRCVKEYLKLYESLI